MTPSRSALRRLSDRQLLASLHAVVGRNRRLTAEMLEHLGEVDVRELCAREAEGSLYMYCVKVLRFSEGCAYKRIAAARAARAYPVILDMVARGDLHVSAIDMLVPHLTAEHHRELLAAAARKSKRELAEILAERFPKPDVESRLRKLPERHAEMRSPQLELSAARAPAPAMQSSQSSLLSDAQGLAAWAMAAASASVSSEVTTGRAGEPSAATLVLSSPAAAGPGSAGLAPAPAYAAARPQDRPSVQPLSPGRYKLQLTLSRQGRDDLLRAQELMRHQQPDGDLAVVVERALSDLVVELERRKFGRLKGRGKGRACASASRSDGAAAGTCVSSESRSSHVREQTAQPNIVGEQPKPAVTQQSKASEQRQVDLPPASNASEQRQVDLPPASNASEQRQVDLPPASNASKQRQVDLPPASNASEQRQVDLPPASKASEQRQVDLPPAANASDRPQVELPPAACIRAAADRGRGRVEGWRRGRTLTKALSRYLPRALVRDVVRRDGMQCTYVGPDGRRCEARDFLEFHHIVAVARGGKATVENLTLRCRIHHGVETVRQFGAEVVLRHRKRRP